MSKGDSKLIDVTVIGAGEYVSGLSPNKDSDKTRGVIALSLFDLRRRGIVGSVTLCARDSEKGAVLKRHFASQIETPYGLDTSFRYFPTVGRNERAWEQALTAAEPGSAVIVVTPDSLHYEISKFALERSLHVLVAKPIVESLAQHLELLELCRKRKVHFRGEYHKRYDPMYRDAMLRASSLGSFNFFSSYMSQPKQQLETFRSWAGLEADVSAYLNSHHLDLHSQMIGDRYRPVQVSAFCSSGIGEKVLGRDIADTISLSVLWESLESTDHGVGNYVASWVAPSSDVHSQQRFFYSAEEGEIKIDQAHRGYSLASSAGGYQSPNPLFMQYEPMDGRFVGQDGYGYKSVEMFLRDSIGEQVTYQDHKDLYVTAILEAGRLSLRERSRPVGLRFAERDSAVPVGLNARPE